MKQIFKIILLMFFLSAYSGSSLKSNCYPRSIFVPRQLSYNPILENALTIDMQHNKAWDCVFSVKPLYTQSVGSTFEEYFTINHKCSLNIQEDGSGDISSLWFKVISSDPTFYNSQLSFNPKRTTYGGLLYFDAQLSNHFHISVNTALINTHNNIHLCEKNINNLGTADYTTVTQSLAASERLFGKVQGAHSKTGFDDIQIKMIYNPYQTKRFYWDFYGLFGIPTGDGSNAHYLFEPLVGSRHIQLGLGTNAEWCITNNHGRTLKFIGEAKYRYGFKAREVRSFDLKKNGQWSRYMLFVNELDKYSTYPAINDLTFNAQVTPRSSFDLYLAADFTIKAWDFELGYNLWCRSAEKISLCSQSLNSVGVADLRGIAAQNPQSASTANIAQGDVVGINQMTSDATFIPVTMSDINSISGAQPFSLSNSIYGAIGYTFDAERYDIQLGIGGSYEKGSSGNTPDNGTVWLSFNLLG